MALLKFNYGLAQDLPEAKANGSLYVTTDDQRLYVDLDDQRVVISDFIEVADMTALTALGSYNYNVFYYVKAENALMKYVGGEMPWKQLNSMQDLSSLESAIDALETSDSAINARIDELDAADIKTAETFTVTTPVGNLKAGDEISITSMQQLLMDMLCKDGAPAVTQPSISNSTFNTAYYEAGKTGTTTVTINYSDGEYAYGFATLVDGSVDTVAKQVKAENVQNDKTTGANATTFTMKLNGVDVTPKSTTATSATYDLAPTAQVGNVQYGASWSVAYSQGNIPVSILKTKYPTSRIAAGTKSGKKDDAIRWYLPMYYGFKTGDNMLDKSALTAAQIQALGSTVTGSNAYAKNAPTTATAAGSWRQFFVAIPEGNGKELKSIIDSNNLPCDFSKCDNVTIKFGSTDVAYEVWCVEHAANYNTVKINLTW